MRRDPKPLFGYYLPFAGIRTEYLYADEAWELMGCAAGYYRQLAVEWLGRGFVFACWPVANGQVPPKEG